MEKEGFTRKDGGGKNERMYYCHTTTWVDIRDIKARHKINIPDLKARHKRVHTIYIKFKNRQK